MKNTSYKGFIFLFLLFFSKLNAFGKQDAEIKQLNDASYLFSKIKHICNSDSGHLWVENLICPLMLINKDTRFFVASDSVPVESCKRHDSFFIGYLPNIYAISNSTLKIGQQNFASVRYSSEKQLDTNLYLRTFIHEMFHIFSDRNGYDETLHSNSHLDTKDGRMYLQLELLALKEALESNGKERRDAIIRALCFRNKRQSIFPESKNKENSFEIQEGLAVYTEYSLGVFSEKKRLNILINDIDELINSKSYINSFGYTTGAVYAFLNNKFQDWRESIFVDKNLSYMTKKIYQIHSTEIDTIFADNYMKHYDYRSVFQKENSLENERKNEKESIIEKLNTGRLLLINIADNSFSGFVPNMYQLRDVGTYYPYMNLSGKFGYIRSQKPCVIKWSEDVCAFFLDEISIENNKSNSNEIKIEINDGWNIVNNGRIYQLIYVGAK